MTPLAKCCLFAALAMKLDQGELCSQGSNEEVVLTNVFKKIIDNYSLMEEDDVSLLRKGSFDKAIKTCSTINEKVTDEFNKNLQNRAPRGQTRGTPNDLTKEKPSHHTVVSTTPPLPPSFTIPPPPPLLGSTRANYSGLQNVSPATTPGNTQEHMVLLKQINEKVKNLQSQISSVKKDVKEGRNSVNKSVKSVWKEVHRQGRQHKSL